jgi:hypothetical protein
MSDRRAETISQNRAMNSARGQAPDRGSISPLHARALSPWALNPLEHSMRLSAASDAAASPAAINWWPTNDVWKLDTMVLLLLLALDQFVEDARAWPTYSSMATVSLVSLTALWSYALLGPLSILPSERGAFKFLWLEKRALSIPSPAAWFLSREPDLVTTPGKSWAALRAQFESAYRLHRRANAALFLPSRVGAAIVLVGAVAYALFCFAYAAALSSLATGLTGGAVLAFAFLPTVITVAASRRRWRRRAPFELQWVHEATAVLSRHRGAADSGTLERAEILGDIGDMHHVLSRRHWNSSSGSSRKLAQKHWSSATQNLTFSAAAFEGRPAATSDEVWTWLTRHVNQASKAFLRDRPKRSTQTVPRQPRRLYSSDKAALTLVVMLVTATAGLLGAAFILATGAPVDLSWDGVAPWITGLSSLLALIGAGLPLIRKLLQSDAPG